MRITKIVEVDVPGILLDVNHTYVTKDANEIWWNFKYETIAGIGTVWNAYRRKPGEANFFCVGQWQEENIWQWLQDNGYKITKDDEEDLLIWLNTGGYEEILENTKPNHQEEVPENGESG